MAQANQEVPVESPQIIDNAPHMKHARSHFMELAQRAALLMMSRYPAEHGRLIMRAQSLEELARRAVLKLMRPGCGRVRAERVALVVAGRQSQVAHAFSEFSSMYGTWHQSEFAASMASMVTHTQTMAAIEAVDEVMKGVQK